MCWENDAPSLPAPDPRALPPGPLAGAIAGPPVAGAAFYRVGPRLNPPATVDTTGGLGYQGVDTHVPASPEAPGGVIHTSHFGADAAIWNAAVEGRSAAMPRDGQADMIRLEGCGVGARGGPPPLDEIHFQTLAAQGNGMKVALTSGAFTIPVCGKGGAGCASVNS